MPIAEAGGYCHNPYTLDICLPHLDTLAHHMPPSQLAVLLGSFSMAPWSPKSLMRNRLLMAAFKALPRCVAS